MLSSPPLFPIYQLLRKRHIGNDIVTIIFQEPGALPFTPKNIRSHFQHVFIIVRAHNPCTDNVCYRYTPPHPLTYRKSQKPFPASRQHAEAGSEWTASCPGGLPPCFLFVLQEGSSVHTLHTF